MLSDGHSLRPRSKTTISKDVHYSKVILNSSASSGPTKLPAKRGRPPLISKIIRDAEYLNIGIYGESFEANDHISKWIDRTRSLLTRMTHLINGWDQGWGKALTRDESHTVLEQLAKISHAIGRLEMKTPTSNKLRHSKLIKEFSQLQEISNNLYERVYSIMKTRTAPANSALYKQNVKGDIVSCAKKFPKRSAGINNRAKKKPGMQKQSLRTNPASGAQSNAGRNYRKLLNFESSESASLNDYNVSFNPDCESHNSVSNSVCVTRIDSCKGSMKYKNNPIALPLTESSFTVNDRVSSIKNAELTKFNDSEMCPPLSFPKTVLNARSNPKDLSYSVGTEIPGNQYSSKFCGSMRDVNDPNGESMDFSHSRYSVHEVENMSVSKIPSEMNGFSKTDCAPLDNTVSGGVRNLIKGNSNCSDSNRIYVSSYIVNGTNSAIESKQLNNSLGSVEKCIKNVYTNNAVNHGNHNLNLKRIANSELVSQMTYSIDLPRCNISDTIASSNVALKNTRVKRPLKVLKNRKLTSLNKNTVHIRNNEESYIDLTLENMEEIEHKKNPINCSSNLVDNHEDFNSMHGESWIDSKPYVNELKLLPHNNEFLNHSKDVAMDCVESLIDDKFAIEKSASEIEGSKFDSQKTTVIDKINDMDVELENVKHSIIDNGNANSDLTLITNYEHQDNCNIFHKNSINGNDRVLIDNLNNTVTAGDKKSNLNHSHECIVNDNEVTFQLCNIDNDQSVVINDGGMNGLNNQLINEFVYQEERSAVNDLSFLMDCDKIVEREGLSNGDTVTNNNEFIDTNREVVDIKLSSIKPSDGGNLELKNSLEIKKHLSGYCDGGIKELDDAELMQNGLMRISISNSLDIVNELNKNVESDVNGIQNGNFKKNDKCVTNKTTSQGTSPVNVNNDVKPNLALTNEFLQFLDDFEDIESKSNHAISNENEVAMTANFKNRDTTKSDIFPALPTEEGKCTQTSSCDVNYKVFKKSNNKICIQDNNYSVERIDSQSPDGTPAKEVTVKQTDCEERIDEKLQLYKAGSASTLDDRGEICLTSKFVKPYLVKNHAINHAEILETAKNISFMTKKYLTKNASSKQLSNANMISELPNKDKLSNQSCDAHNFGRYEEDSIQNVPSEIGERFKINVDNACNGITYDCVNNSYKITPCTIADNRLLLTPSCDKENGSKCTEASNEVESFSGNDYHNQEYFKNGFKNNNFSSRLENIDILELVKVNSSQLSKGKNRGSSSASVEIYSYQEESTQVPHKNFNEKNTSYYDLHKKSSLETSKERKIKTQTSVSNGEFYYNRENRTLDKVMNGVHSSTLITDDKGSLKSSDLNHDYVDSHCDKELTITGVKENHLLSFKNDRRNCELFKPPDNSGRLNSFNCNKVNNSLSNAVNKVDGSSLNCVEGGNVEVITSHKINNRNVRQKCKLNVASKESDKSIEDIGSGKFVSSKTIDSLECSPSRGQIKLILPCDLTDRNSQRNTNSKENPEPKHVNSSCQTFYSEERRKIFDRELGCRQIKTNCVQTNNAIQQTDDVVMFTLPDAIETCASKDSDPEISIGFNNNNRFDIAHEVNEECQETLLSRNDANLKTYLIKKCNSNVDFKEPLLSRKISKLDFTENYMAQNNLTSSEPSKNNSHLEIYSTRNSPVHVREFNDIAAVDVNSSAMNTGDFSFMMDNTFGASSEIVGSSVSFRRDSPFDSDDIFARIKAVRVKQPKEVMTFSGDFDRVWMDQSEILSVIDDW